MKEYGIRVYYLNHSDKEQKPEAHYYGGITYHKFYGETLRLCRNKNSGAPDVFIPIRNVAMLVYVES